MRSMEWLQLTGVILYGNFLSLVNDEEVSRTRRCTYFQILCYALEKDEREPRINSAWEEKLTWFKNSSQYRTLDTIDGESMEFEWNIFPGFATLQLCNNVQEFLSKMSEEPQDFTGRIIFMSMFNDISWRSKDNEQECELSPKLVSICARRFSPGRWSFLGLGSEKKWYSILECKPQGEWDRVAWWGNDWNCFSHNFFVNQLSIYGAVSNLCEECKTCHVRTVRLVMAGQSGLLFVPTSSLMKTRTLLTDDLAQEDLLQKYQERVERYHNKIVWFCFVLMQDSWQRLMSESTSWQKTLKNSHNLQIQWLVVSTLCQDEKSSDPKGCIRGNTKIGPAVEVTTSFLQGKYGVEIRIESVNKDNSHSWVRISHGLNKLVTDLSNNKENDNNEQETSEMQFDNFVLKSNARAFASRSKAKAKPRRRTPACSSARTVPTGEKKVDWCRATRLFVQSITQCQKQLSTLLRHGHLLREEDGAIEFWTIKEYLRNDLERSQHWSDEKWKSTMAKGGGNKKRFQYCTDPSGQEIL